jgi:hypothetical protein
MANKVQEAAKQKVVELLKEFDVAYIDYDAKDNDYTIRLEAKDTQDNKCEDLLLDERVQD